MLSGSIDSNKIIYELIRKRIEITSLLNEQVQKKIEIDKLVRILEKEGFQMDKKINLLSIDQESVHEIKKNIPNMEMFLETANNISALCPEDESIAVFRFDISHFKQINDDYGFDVGDRVIVACYNIIHSNSVNNLIQSALGRAHGDEFIVFARAGKKETEITAQAIIDEMKTYDFSSIGCKKEMGCYIGGVTGKQKTDADIRHMIESSIEVLDHARNKGRNSFVIQ
jgi:diguanylate cyclase (GGDEF)-like protein